MRMNKRFSGYIITNVITGKQYVGITSKTPQRRLKVHFLDSSNKRIRYKNHLHNSIRKHGKEFFKIECIKKADTWEEICSWERDSIKEFKTKAPYGYNLTDGGEGAYGFIRSDESNKKLSKSKIEFYKIQENREKHSVICKEVKNRPDEINRQKKKSKELWQDTEYREKTTRRIQESWKTGLFSEKHKLSLRKSTIENPEWIKRNAENNLHLSKDPKWRNKVKNGIKEFFSDPIKAENNCKNKSKSIQKYWDEGQEERRKKHAEVMSETIKKNLNKPEYQKWRLNNPPGSKPILYKFKYFRSIQEAADFFKVDRTTVDRHLLKKIDGCERLDKNGKYKFEIQYD